MKLTTGILILGMAAGTAWAQNPDVIENTRNTMNAVVQKKAIDSNAALAASQGQAANPSTPASGKAATATPAKPASARASSGPAAKPASKSKVAVASHAKPASKSKVAVTPHVAAKPKTAHKPAAARAKAAKAAQPQAEVAVADKANPEAKKESSKVINLTGRRDPFVSPVVNRTMVGSGCSTGKRCLAVDQINLKGVVKAEAGMIAVVVNAMNKAYFLRENDPVFNGYVVKITGDSIIFKETIPDKLGKPFTREVTKKIITPAV
jgi:Tfp pilus assembly protein PilP